MNWICFGTSFLGDEVAHILQCNNAKDANKKEECDKGDLFKVFGILYALTTVEIPSHRSYWPTDSAGHQHQLLENALAWAIIVLRIL